MSIKFTFHYNYLFEEDNYLVGEEKLCLNKISKNTFDFLRGFYLIVAGFEGKSKRADLEFNLSNAIYLMSCM